MCTLQGNRSAKRDTDSWLCWLHMTKKIVLWLTCKCVADWQEKLAELQLQVDSQASKQPMGGPAARLGTDVPSDDLA